LSISLTYKTEDPEATVENSSPSLSLQKWNSEKKENKTLENVLHLSLIPEKPDKESLKLSSHLSLREKKILKIQNKTPCKLSLTLSPTERETQKNRKRKPMQETLVHLSCPQQGKEPAVILSP
jgi:hypothetical protein